MSERNDALEAARAKKRARLAVISAMERREGTRSDDRLPALRLLAEVDLSLDSGIDAPEPLDQQIDLMINRV